ncbi:hypothetical protein PPL_12504 [Heterostelium album PN500]|uniref:SD-repeat containing protein B domain-containing protein n=1 Tax=Heterostelium pallidum (strain ATCC 26659 / Pp 5 / PN500) TaxID=670386 RepID=D3BMT1_HETP5|nr:hypothetical protein PPL_12504 [Heterostelium album PN500]EFA77293.1 hypothetical protein PPL_12504 [Heterostelium album PN500]|eukprot:XP_020429422.1 hypothetical protein PPL_12504 [Heterostelium album PN500]
MKVPNQACKFEADWKIFAVKIFKGDLYVGGVCTGETGDQLDGVIMRFNSKQEWEVIVQFDLDYKERGGVKWTPWSRTATTPQPMITQLAFDDSGDMAIAVRDRTTDTRDGTSWPDLYLACPNKYGDYEFEAYGKCGGRQSVPGPGQGTGPGGYHFLDASGTRGQNVAGGVARAGPTGIVASGSDIMNAYEGGVSFIDTNNGTRLNRFEIYNQASPGNFAKASGLGALVDMYAPSAPSTYECGRIWFDCNSDGRQDCGEPGIPNVRVYLYDQTNLTAPAANTTSDDKGNFNFELKPGRKYACVIPVAEVMDKFGPFILTPI